MPEEIQARQLVVFTLGTEQYSLPIDHVHEIIRYSEPRSVASPISWVRGVISLRGRIIAVYDLAARLGISAEPPGDSAKIVIVESNDETVGVIVDEVDEVLTVDVEAFEMVAGADSELIESIARLEDRLIVLLKPSAILGIFGQQPAQAA